MNKISLDEGIHDDICKHRYDLPPSEEGLIHAVLPDEVFKKILSYLNNKEILSADLVSHFWNKNLMDVVQGETFSSRKKFVDFLVENLVDPARKKELLDLREDRGILKLGSYRDIKLSTESSVEAIIKTLKGLNKTELNSLRKMYKVKAGPVFDNLLAVADLYKDLDQASVAEDRLCRVDRLQRISMLFLVYRKIDKAVEVANMMPDDYEKALTIQGVSDALMQLGRVEKAIAVAHTIQKEYIRTETLEQITITLFKRGLVHRASEVAKMIPNYLDRSHMQARLAKLLIKSGKLEEASSIAKDIEDPYYRNKLLKELLSCHDAALNFTSGNRIPVGNQKRAI